MLTRSSLNPVRLVAVGLVAGLMSFSAAAMEEVIVYGKDAAPVDSERVELRAELKEYLENLNRELKDQLDEELKKRSAASIKLALAEVPSRG